MKQNCGISEGSVLSEILYFPFQHFYMLNRMNI